MSNNIRRSIKYKAGDIEFTFQHPGVRKTTEIKDKTIDQDGQVKEAPLFEELMAHVIVFPKTTWDWWDEHDDIVAEVMAEAYRFLILTRKTYEQLGGARPEELAVLEANS